MQHSGMNRGLAVVRATRRWGKLTTAELMYSVGKSRKWIQQTTIKYATGGAHAHCTCAIMYKRGVWHAGLPQAAQSNTTTAQQWAAVQGLPGFISFLERLCPLEHHCRGAAAACRQGARQGWGDCGQLPSLWMMGMQASFSPGTALLQGTHLKLLPQP